MAMEERDFTSALELEEACRRAAARGTLVLGSTGRLARRLLHRYRQAAIAKGRPGWETPPVMSFRGWVSLMHQSLWSEGTPLTRTSSLTLWHEAAAGVDPPAGLVVTPSLYLGLQDALDALADRALPLQPAASGLPLPDWRRAVSARFLRQAARRRRVRWTDVLRAVGQAVEGKGAGGAEALILAGFDQLTPVESDFVERLARRRPVSLWRTGPARPPGCRVRVYASPEQECRAVCEEVLESWNGGSKNLGVVCLDRELMPVLRRCFDELAGEDRRPDLEREVRYNLTAGSPLAEHPLVAEALLPLRIAVETDFRPLLASLLASPYVHASAGARGGVIRSCLWDRGAPLDLRGTLSLLGTRGLPAGALGRLAAAGPRPLRAWLAGLAACWRELGFARLEDVRRDLDVLARRHLEEVLEELEREAGGVETDASGALAWTLAAASGVRVSEPTGEVAGIQVLNLAESRALAFERLWVVGVHGDSLPQRPRENPLLDPDERRAVEGGTTEDQWVSAGRQLSGLLALAPTVTLTRAAVGPEDAPLPPSPLVEDEADPSGRVSPLTVDLWRGTPPAWRRARWLRLGLEGASTPAGAGPAEGPPVRPLTGEWAVTRLASLVACPYQFYAGQRLGLEPLEAPEAGIDPRERGGVIHRILERFVNGLADHAPDWPAEDGRDVAWLAEAATSELAKQPDNLFWRVERTRLLGEGALGGVLTAWLAQERERRRQGWVFKAAEKTFEGLPLAGITLKGRVDRVDHHPAAGYAVWDYKSGRAPSSSAVLRDATEIQLPAYLMALKGGRLDGLDPGEEPLRAGFIPLRRAADVKVVPLGEGKGAVDWGARLEAVRRALEERLEDPLKGLFRAEPNPAPSGAFSRRGGACEYCGYYNLCGHFDGRMKTASAEDAPGAETEEEP